VHSDHCIAGCSCLCSCPCVSPYAPAVAARLWQQQRRWLLLLLQGQAQLQVALLQLLQLAALARTSCSGVAVLSKRRHPWMVLLRMLCSLAVVANRPLRFGAFCCCLLLPGAPGLNLR
jgi:cellulose synthase/poly-beta-1,6-N-acetylglucosamine synthase-like glycosyltransferase